MITNRPGLSAIAYRIGTYGSIRQAMIDQISATPDLAGWTSRQPDDFGIVALEMWAHVADILTFYQERIANEAFLRTAVRRDSLMRLASTIDYKPDPGAAATTWLAFTVAKETSIPVGLRVQSVPGEGEKPQKFETVEPLAEVRPEWNRLRAYPEPATDSPLAAGTTSGTALNDVSHLAPGDRLVLYKVQEADDDGKVHDVQVEDKMVAEIAAVDWRTELRWSPAVQKNRAGAQLSKWVRKFRLFGAQAPETYHAIETDGDLVKATVNFEAGGGSKLYLDGLYDDLKVNTQILLVRPGPTGFVWRATVTGVGQAQREIKGDTAVVPLITSTVTELSFDETVPDIPNLRKVVLYELAGEPVAFWPYSYAAAGISDEYIYLHGAVDLPEGRTILLDDGAGDPAVRQVAEAVHLADSDHTKVKLDEPLERSFNGETTYLMANVAYATHGESVKQEVLGSGDPSQAYQTFALKKTPLTYVPDPTADGGAASTLEVRVDGVLWEETDSFYEIDPDARLYTVERDSEGVATVRFGDGENGARLPRGSANITATYRHGLGEAGRVRASTLTNALDKVVGLKSVTNPGAAAGGVEPETEAVMREDAPTTVLTFDRAVSLKDFADLARSYVGIAKARATWTWDGRNRVVQLTVAGEDGATIAGDQMTSLVAYLNLRRDPNRQMTVASYKPVYVSVEAGVEVDPAHEAETVLAAASQALIDHFAFVNRQFGQWVHVSDLYAVLEAVEGVSAAYVRYPTANQPIEPDELALLADETAVTVVEGGMV